MSEQDSTNSQGGAPRYDAPRRLYKPGDRVNGYILGNDNQWWPAAPEMDTRQMYTKSDDSAKLVIRVVILILLVPFLVVAAAVLVPLILAATQR